MNAAQLKQHDKMRESPMHESEDTFIISDTFESGADDLFHMWVTPEIYTQWMGPAGAKMSFINADIREGGTAFWQMTTPDGLTKYGQLHFQKIHRSKQLTYVQHFCDENGNFIKAPFLETYPDSLLLTVDFDEEGSKQHQNDC